MLPFLKMVSELIFSWEHFPVWTLKNKMLSLCTDNYSIHITFRSLYLLFSFPTKFLYLQNFLSA